MRKNNRGFTLIELLAIIVILAIIAVITVPIILNIIENSRKGAATDSAYGYKDAINKYYLTRLSDNPNWNELDGTYNINSDGNLKKSETETYNINVSGQHPTDGYIVIQGKSTSGCLVYGDYAITINNGEVTNTKKGDCKFATQDDATTTGELSIGDLICINDTDECFYVISNENGITSMLARYNLLVGQNFDRGTFTPISEDIEGYGWQNEAAIGHTSSNSSTGQWPSVIEFSSTHYWTDSDLYLKSEYAKDIQGNTAYYWDSNNPYPYVYDSNSNLYTYVNNYKSNLESIGVNVNNVRLMTYEETTNDKIGCTDDSSTSHCPDWILNTSFWLGSVPDGANVWSVNTYVTRSYLHSYGYDFGVRPVIEIPTSAIELKSE